MFTNFKFSGDNDSVYDPDAYQHKSKLSESGINGIKKPQPSAVMLSNSYSSSKMIRGMKGILIRYC